MELKDELKNKLDAIEDNHPLEEMADLSKLDGSEKTVFEIPAEHNRSVEIGLQEVENGKTKTNNEVQSNLKKWLYK